MKADDGSIGRRVSHDFMICRTTEPAFRTALSVLKLAVSGTCQESAVALLSKEIQTLRQRVSELLQMQSRDRSRASDSHALNPASGADETDVRRAALVDRALAHFRRHYQAPRISLRAVARELECNPRYLTTRFTKIVGEHLHTYLNTLRVFHACRLLLESDASIKEIAYASGFSGPGRLASAFRVHVGVSPREYRRILAGP